MGILSFSPEGSVVFRSPGPFVFQFPQDWPLLAGSGLRWYGLLMGIAVGTGLFLARSLAERRRLEREPGQASERIEQLALWLVIAGFAGARLYYVATHWSTYAANPLASLAIWQGGIIIHGGILGGVLALYLYSRFTQIDVWRYADVLAPSLILGQAIGRWGNFFNSEAYGAPIALESGWPLREFIPEAARVPEFSNFEFFHPIFFYESALNLLLFALLMVMFWKIPKLKPGTWVWTYVVGYSLIRIPYEILRISAVAYLGNTSIKVAYIASAVGIVLGVGMLVYMYRFRYDPNLEALTAWLSSTAGLDLMKAEDLVQRAWLIQQRHRQTDLMDRVILAMPNFPSTMAESLSRSQREHLMQELFQKLEGKSPSPVGLLTDG
ncbi:MAG: prolipoprotein diacylglyceryl transferase [Synechococcaceae cyanobacterium SM2_3_1]|nr:prolipoprotein diacylglyceryl transferase [Synechococcaceae cyanobacterium SM2_3_1]